MYLPVIAIVAGIVCLVWSADRFVDGAAAVARRLGVSELIVGMVIVGFGTSMPEMAVSALSAWQGAPGIALGNAYGSNIANITLILGVSALVSPMSVKPRIVRREIPLLFLATVFTALLISFDQRVTRFDAVLLMVFFVVSMAVSSRGSRSAPEKEDAASELSQPGLSLKAGLVWSLVGLAVLMASSQSLVWGASAIARGLGISDLTIGLTVVAVGTSLPELASSVAAARKIAMSWRLAMSSAPIFLTRWSSSA